MEDVKNLGSTIGRTKLKLLSKVINLYTLSVAVCNTDETANKIKHPTYEQMHAARKLARKDAKKNITKK